MTLRITGLSSNLDVDSMVKTLMKAEQGNRDKLLKQQTSITWKQEAYRDISTSLVDFRNNKLDKYNTLATMSAKKSEVTGNSTAVAIASTNSSAVGTMSVTVEKLAVAARGVYNTTFALTDADPSMSSVYDSGNPGNNKIVVNGIDITFSNTDTIGSVLSRINSNRDINVTAMYSNGKISITNNKAGDYGVTGNAVINFPEFTQDPAYRVNGGDAAYTVNGLSMTSKSNSVSVNGVGLQLKAVTGPNGAAVVSSGVDTEKIMSTIKSFIADYNSVLDQVNGKLKEKQYRNYQPLTNDEKESMSDKQVELWEDKAKSGLLYNDSILSSMINDMRISAIADFDLGSGKKINIQSFGISTGKWTDYGKLVIEDEDKLRQAIENDPDSVTKLFTARGANADPTSADGLFKN